MVSSLRVPVPGVRRHPPQHTHARRPRACLAWLSLLVAETPSLHSRCPGRGSASLQVSRREDRGAGHTPSPAGPLRPRSLAAEPAAGEARTGGQGDLLRSGPRSPSRPPASDPERLVLRRPRAPGAHSGAGGAAEVRLLYNEERAD